MYGLSINRISEKEVEAKKLLIEEIIETIVEKC